uniref:Uncharacterized protein n=1 Tax=Arundo donax TaxID=35708 RepID=A0A0A9TK25_ARUDO
MILFPSLAKYLSSLPPPHLKIGHETAETATLPPDVNSSALPLKSRITFPVLTSKIFRTTLCESLGLMGSWLLYVTKYLSSGEKSISFTCR